MKGENGKQGLIWGVVLILALLVAKISAEAQVRYGAGTWNKLEFGNHRAVIHVDGPAPAVSLWLKWLRVDAGVDQKELVIVSKLTGAKRQFIVNLT